MSDKAERGINVKSSTRDAVETAFDLARGAKKKTWEEIGYAARTRISKWEESALRGVGETNDETDHPAESPIDRHGQSEELSAQKEYIEDSFREMLGPS